MSDTKKDQISNKYILFLGVGSLILFFTYIFAVTFLKVPIENRGYVDIIIGFLSGTIASTVINFYFGSSETSKSKDKTISDLQNNSTYTPTMQCPDPSLHEHIYDDTV